jgi:hypothetical protein
MLIINYFSEKKGKVKILYNSLWEEALELRNKSISNAIICSNLAISRFNFREI